MSRSFTRLHGIAAPLPVANVDTDMLFPASFLKTISRKGLGRALFHAQRYSSDGAERPDFILNRDPWRNAQILIALHNFGCGSSREHAPWALLDYGIRCVIAPSFADIFYGNCFKNGILPVRLPDELIRILLQAVSDPQSALLAVDLQSQTISSAGNDIVCFEVEAQRREMLLQGLDEIDNSLRFESEIARAEVARVTNRPWIRPDQEIGAFVLS